MNHEIHRLVAPEVYQEARPTLFPSKSSIRWYMRRHKAALAERGATVMHGNRWLVDQTRFDLFVKEESQKLANELCALYKTPTSEQQDQTANICVKVEVEHIAHQRFASIRVEASGYHLCIDANSIDMRRLARDLLDACEAIDPQSHKQTEGAPI